jgi:hypothetical protein
MSLSSSSGSSGRESICQSTLLAIITAENCGASVTQHAVQRLQPQQKASLLSGAGIHRSSRAVAINRIRVRWSTLSWGSGNRRTQRSGDPTRSCEARQAREMWGDILVKRVPIVEFDVTSDESPATQDEQCHAVRTRQVEGDAAVRRLTLVLRREAQRGRCAIETALEKRLGMLCCTI